MRHAGRLTASCGLRLPASSSCAAWPRTGYVTYAPAGNGHPEVHAVQLLADPAESGLTRTVVDGPDRRMILRSADLDQRFPGLLTAILRVAQRTTRRWRRCDHRGGAAGTPVARSPLPARPRRRASGARGRRLPDGSLTPGHIALIVTALAAIVPAEQVRPGYMKGVPEVHGRYMTAAPGPLQTISKPAPGSRAVAGNSYFPPGPGMII